MFPDAQLTALLAAFYAAVRAVPTFANASPSVINSVQQPLEAVISRVTTLILQVSNQINVSGFAGAQVGIAAQASAASITAQITVNANLLALYKMQSLLGRIANNLSAVTTSANTVPFAGGNLFALAEEEYGDALSWTAIANANGLTDPFVQGPVTLVIPPQSAQSGGVLES